MFFDNPVLAFKNLHTALKPTGRMLFLCWRKIQENPSMAEPVRIALEVLSPPAATETPDPTAPEPFSLSNPAYLTTILQASGFNNLTAVASIRVQILIPGTLSMRLYPFAMRLQFEAK
jgi:hypothetical protein